METRTEYITRNKKERSITKMAKRLTKKEREILYNLGVTAFKNGLPGIPANDKKLMEYIKGCQVGEGLPYIKAWLKGWHSANLAN